MLVSVENPRRVSCQAPASMDVKDELIFVQQQRITLLEAQVEKLKEELHRLRRREKAANDVGEPRTDEDKEREKLQPGWFYIQPYRRVLEDLIRRHPLSIENLMEALRAEEDAHKKKKNVEKEANLQRETTIREEFGLRPRIAVTDVTTDEDLLNYLRREYQSRLVDSAVQATPETVELEFREVHRG